jgi:membrane protease subunit (stomatin/prohibitin family)
MGLFSSNKEGGMMDMIRCDEQEYLIWKWRPQGNDANSTKKENSIRYGSSLRVKDGEVAVFVYKQKDGTVQDYIMGPYDETIKTANFPVLSSIIGLAYAGGTPFQAEVYFINLAGNIQIKFGIPYFPVFDYRFTDFSVPVAVRGTLTFNVTDYQAFIKLNRLINFELDTFKTQIKDGMTMFIKGMVSNISNSLQVSVVQVSNYVLGAQQLIFPTLKADFERDFGVNIKRLDIAAIEVDTEDSSYGKLRELTANITEAYTKTQAGVNIDTMQAQSAINIQNMADMQAINAGNMEESLRIQREEMQRAQQLQTETNFFDTHKLNIQTDAQKTILTSAADSLGAMGNMNLGGGGGGGMNPAGMMTGMMMGGAMGGQMANMMNNMGNNMQQNMQGGPGAMPPGAGPAGGPPPPPQSAFHVSVNGQQSGPFNMQQLQQLVMNGQLTPVTFVWKAGMAEWAEANKLIELQQLFNAAPPPPPPPVR